MDSDPLILFLSLGAGDSLFVPRPLPTDPPLILNHQHPPAL